MSAWGHRWLTLTFERHQCHVDLVYLVVINCDQFYYRATAKHTHGIAAEILSVRLSVCLPVRASVKRVYCDKTKAPSENVQL